MPLDDHTKHALKDFGKAISDCLSESLSQSEQVAELFSSLRAAGLDIDLHLNAEISLARSPLPPPATLPQDRIFPHTVHVRVSSQAGIENAAVTNVEATPPPRRAS